MKRHATTIRSFHIKAIVHLASLNPDPAKVSPTTNDGTQGKKFLKCYFAQRKTQQYRDRALIHTSFPSHQMLQMLLRLDPKVSTSITSQHTRPHLTIQDLTRHQTPRTKPHFIPRMLSENRRRLIRRICVMPLMPHQLPGQLQRTQRLDNIARLLQRQYVFRQFRDLGHFS